LGAEGAWELKKGVSRVRVFGIGEGEIFGLEWEQLAVDWRRMYNEKLYDPYN
jgi:hypothetical protein